eukprot:425048-Amphidinium_carterae.1
MHLKDVLYIVMEHANGGDLSRRIMERKKESVLFSERTVLQLLHIASGSSAVWRYTQLTTLCRRGTHPPQYRTSGTRSRFKPLVSRLDHLQVQDLAQRLEASQCFHLRRGAHGTVLMQTFFGIVSGGSHQCLVHEVTSMSGA